MNPFRQDVIFLNRGEDTNCSVNLYGGNITSWRVRNREQLFVSRNSRFDNKQVIYGGIQILFPRFKKWDYGYVHGFSRFCKWKVESPPEKLPNGDIEAIFSLIHNPFTLSMWASNFKIVYQVILRERELYMKLLVENICDHFKMTFDLFIEPYIKVPALKKVYVKGFKNQKYVNNFNNELIARHYDEIEDRYACIKSKRQIDRIYRTTPEEFLMNKIMDGHKLKFAKTNCKNVFFWNPGRKLYSSSISFRENEYKRMVAVGLGNLQKSLLPHETFEISVTLTQVEVEKEEDKIRNYIALEL